ncbi:MAG TPA: hypothetical protein VFU55_12955 [Terracidiphilus sp.]|nr:hypothetical protein [Terracidiphilus sp.]
MAGLILDNVVIYVVLTTIRLFWRLRSKRWPLVKGTLPSATLSTWLYDCPIIRYKYSVEGKVYSGSYRRGFWLNKKLAEKLAHKFENLKFIAVRHHPIWHSSSYLWEEDQRFKGPFVEE